MKFHHLSRHNNQFAGAHNQAQQRDASPGKHQQQAASMQKQHHQLTDDEDDDFNDPQTYFDVIDQQQQQQQQQHHHLHSQQANNQALDASGFLMDKNKKLFPQKLWELIHNPTIQHCLRWSQDGQRVYLNRNEFEAYYLKTPNNQFHTQKAISFVRQMNMYGFRKVDDCYYENDNFRRDRQHLLRNMIRRHPNKGLFVGLDHHQLAAAAAAQQALQVNQQLHQLEHQHKHRTEQALRINSYLNNHHQRFHQSGLVGHQLHNHSSPFEHMSSQLAQAAANHLSQQQQQHQQHQHQQQQGANGSLPANSNVGSLGTNNNHLSNNQSAAAALSVHLQPKKSRLLSNFYASTISSSSNNNNNNNNLANSTNNNQTNRQLSHNQDSMHSTSSVDTEPSQCSSVVNSGSAGSPQPNSPSVLHQRLAALTNNRHQSSSANQTSIRAAALAGGQDSSANNKFASQDNLNQLAATDLSSQSLATRQALHQTLVRSLLQLKQHQHPQDLLASLQQQQSSRSLLESLASLSSAGTGSIVDPTSNSPTERTATPPSTPPSPPISIEDKYVVSQYLDNDNMALDLARSSTSFNMKVIGGNEADEAQEEDTEVEEEEHESGLVGGAGSPLDCAKKVKRFLDNQMCEEEEDEESKIKREANSDHQLELSQKKRIKLSNNNPLINEELSKTRASKALIIEICERRGDRLDVAALQEAARYTECFLEILLDDAALIASHSLIESEFGEGHVKGSSDHDVDIKGGRGSVVDASSLSLALKLIPSKLLAAIQQQVNIKSQSS